MTLKERVDNLYLNEYEKLLQESYDERSAQRKAMSFSLSKAITEFDNYCASEIWKAVHAAHIKRKSGADLTSEQIEKVISAEQSWKKSSGHAFEEFLKSYYFEAIENSGIQLLLQRDISEMIKRGELGNRPRDLTLIESWIEESVFDLFMVCEKDGSQYVFGTVQAKTSIRDRVTRDREPAIQAMANFFWAVALVLDADFLKQPKFKAMVNGGSSNYPSNGWHGMYSFSDIEPCGRIFDQANFVSHAKKAVHLWLNERQEFDADWTP